MAQFHRSFTSSIAPAAACVAVGCLLLAACSGDGHACEETQSCRSTDSDSGHKRDGAAGASGGAGTAGSGGMSNDAGGTSDGSNAGASGTADSGPILDTTPPTVVSIVPADGAKGVVKDADIVITFSEPMNQQGAQAAYQSADVPAANAVFTWNAEGTVLTVNPNSELAYATGGAPATTEPYSYGIAVTTTATDRAGNPLASDTSARFSTLRRITHTLTLPAGKGQSLNAAGSVLSCPATRMLVGDGDTNAQAKAVMTFDITDYPAGIVAIENSTLIAKQAPYFPPNGLGYMMIEHTNYKSVDLGAFSGPALLLLGFFSTDNVAEPKAMDVLVAVHDDYVHRSERSNQSQYRFAYEVASDKDGVNDLMTFACDPAPRLETVYLLP